MIDNLNYRLAKIQKELERQTRQYLYAVNWNQPTKAIVYKIMYLRNEEGLLLELIDEAQKASKPKLCRF